MSFTGYLTGILGLAACAIMPWFMARSVLGAFEFERDGVEQQAQIVALIGKQTVRASTGCDRGVRGRRADHYHGRAQPSAQAALERTFLNQYERAYETDLANAPVCIDAVGAGRDRAAVT